MNINIESSLVQSFIHEINSSGIRYCHFKSNSSLPLSMVGETDLDLLFEPGSEEDLALIMSKIGCVLFQSPLDRSYDDVFDYIGYDGQLTKPIHFHCHFCLDIGEKWVKSYHLPWQEDILASSYRDSATSIFKDSPEWELVLLILRQTTRIYSSDIFIRKKLPSISAKAKDEFFWLKNQIDFSRLDRILNDSFSKHCGSSIRRVIDSNYTPESFHAIRQDVLSELSKYRKYSQFRAASKFYSRKVFHYLKKRLTFIERFSPGRRTLNGPGFALIVVGTDGSGKTTVCRRIVSNLLKKVSIEYVYLGHGKSGASPLFLFLTRSLGYLHRRSPKRLNFFRDLLGLLIVLRRLYFLRLTKSLITQGRLVCMDRFPQFNKPGLSDGTFFLDKKRLWLSIPYRVEMLVKKLADELTLDLVVQLYANKEILMSRLLDKYDPVTLNKKKSAINDFLSKRDGLTIELDTGKYDPDTMLGIIIPKAFEMISEHGN